MVQISVLRGGNTTGTVIDNKSWFFLYL